MDESDAGYTSQLDAMHDAFRDIEEDEDDGNIYVHDSDMESGGKVFYEIPPDLSGRIRMYGGFDPSMTFVAALRNVVEAAEEVK